MNLARFFKFSAVTLITCAHAAYAIEPGVYDGATSNDDFQFVVAQDGSYSSNSKYLASKGLANGKVTQLNGNFVELSDEEDEIEFLDIGFAESIGNDIHLINVSSRSRRPVALRLSLTDEVAPESILPASQIVLGTWSVSINQPGRFRFGRPTVKQGFITFNDDGSYDTDLQLFQGVAQSYSLVGDKLVLERSFTVSKSGSRVGTRTNRYTLNLGVVSDAEFEVLSTSGGVFGRRPSTRFSASFSR
ncbi:hypothetical protein [uncultured Pseudoteredinibacter sp.]|uniref:hypothetical protein n=1 Tax=uncultured Pseudoteredinibacter sp. TaxID=1641701 RepID=UPI00260A5438|nr:hypothetical protein [uncultured Pseudoteredinibacter sp.]